MFTSFVCASISVLCCANELSILSSVKKGEVNTGEQSMTTGELLLISGTDVTPLSNSNKGDTSFDECVGYCISVISPEEDSFSNSGVFLRGGVGCGY